MILTRTRLILSAALMIALVVLAACGKDGGMYQGGGDSQPRWVR